MRLSWGSRHLGRLAAAVCFAAGLWLGAGVQRAAAQAQPVAGALNLAMVGEPQTLDPMASTADLVATIMQHVYEPLFTFDASWNVVPLLAEALPAPSPDGLRYRIELRKGVKLHSGRELDSADVVASLQRWMELSPRGKSLAAELASLTAQGPHAVEIALKRPYAPLLAQLALPTAMAAIMAKESIAQPLASFVGTGPYRFVERRPDQYVVLARFEQYSARAEPASGYGGRREALAPELRFVPVPSASTRVEGALAGQFHFADQLPLSALARLEGAPEKTVPVLGGSLAFPYLVLNTAQGVLASAPLRRALQLALGEDDMLLAGFGDPRFFSAEPSHFPKGTPFYSEAGAALYNQADAEKAKVAAAAAGYKGEPIRVMTSRQYDFHYNMALVLAEQLESAGFAPQLDVVDWATLTQRRNDPKLWDIYISHSPQFPEPMLSPPQLGEGAPGGWSTPAKQAALAALNGEIDPAKRGALWGAVQQLVYDEVPYVVVGRFKSLSARSPRLEGYTPATWPFFWNAKAKP